MRRTGTIPPFRRWRLAAAIALVAVAPLAYAKKLTLPQLMELAHGNPGLRANAAATAAMEKQATEARLNWLPQGDLLSLLAPSPTVHCLDADGKPNPVQCLTTTSPEASITNISWTRVFTRTEVKLIQPVWDFGKISAGIAAGDAGAAALREKEAGARADIDMNVQRAYWTMKAARDALDALDEGTGYLDTAQKKIEKDLADGTGNFTVTDKLRLRTARADLDTRILEARKFTDIARGGLRSLIGASAPEDLDVDDDPFEPVEVPQRPLAYYEDQARFNRPESRALGFAVKAKRALADLERRREYPDLVLIGTAAFARAGAVDDPQNGFMSHYFNSTTAGVAAGLRMQLDLGPKIARASRVRLEADEMEYRREEALGGIAFEVRTAYANLTEAQGRVAALDKGAKAGKAWISAVAQNFALGLAESRDFSDALVAFFGMRTRYLQAVYDLDIAMSALARATGVSDFRSL